MEAKNILKLSVFFALFVVLAPISIQAAAPASITDLRCYYSGTPGSILLAWTAPSGTPTGYEAHYSYSGINEGNYSLSRAYSQSWEGSATRGLLSGLDQTQYLFFAMKAVNGDGVSGLSNVVWCKAASETASVQSAPSSTISNLQAGSQIPENKNYMINGSSTDIGGLLIQKVEISMDDGQTWHGTALKQTASGADWEYNWISPKAGEYLLRSRAASQTDAVETPKAAIKVEVVQQIVVQNQSSTATTSTSTINATAAATSTTSTAAQSEDQQKRSLLIQIIQLLLQLLGSK